MKIFYTLLMAAMMLSFTGCSLEDLPFGLGNKLTQGKEDDNTGSEISEEAVRRIKKITRHENIPGIEMNWLYEFEYDTKGNITSSKITIVEDEQRIEALYTCDYSTEGVASITESIYYDGELYWEPTTYKINIDSRGYITSYDYQTSGYDGEIWYYTATSDYSEEGFLESWFESGEDKSSGINYSYLDGRLIEIFFNYDYIGYTYQTTIDESFTSDRKIMPTAFDINKALIPEFCPNELFISGAVNSGTLGNYYFDRMYVESLLFYSDEIDRSEYTQDANYNETITSKVIYYENFEEDFVTIPVITANYDKDGYPIEFIADVRECEAEMEITYAAGEIIYENEDGPVYEVVEVDRKIISQGSSTSVGSATITIEYCE